MRRVKRIHRARGMVLVVLLRFLAAAAVFAAVMAGEARLNARAAHHNLLAAARWGDTLDALHRAEMELMLTRMPKPVESRRSSDVERNRFFRFDGRPLKSVHPLPEGVEVRVWDHAGKINLNNLSRTRFKVLLEARGLDEDRVSELLDAWQDWIDRDDLKRLNGAEKEYYERLDPPYAPRNAKLETVEELLLIKGFGELLKDVDLQAVFTVYGNHTGVNPNLANADTLRLLPGGEPKVVEALLKERVEKDLKGRAEINQLIDPRTAQRLLPWLKFAPGNVYTIAVGVPVEGEERAAWGYQRVVQMRGFQQPPQALRVTPYGKLPLDRIRAEDGDS